MPLLISWMIRAPSSAPSIVPRPLFFLSGSRDDDTPSEVTDSLFARAPGAVRWRVEGAGHGGFSRVDPKGLDAALGGFFDGALTAPVLPPGR